MPEERTRAPLPSRPEGVRGIAISKYAEMMCCAVNTINEAIRTQKIQEGLDHSGKKVKIYPDIATLEWARNHAPEKIQNKELKKILNEALLNAGDISQQDVDDAKELDDDAPLIEAERKERIYKAKIAQFNYERAIGMYVLQEDVDKSLFAMGQALRVDLQSIPEYVVDRVMNAKSRKEAVRVMLDAIDEVLTKVADLGTIETEEVEDEDQNDNKEQ